MSTEAQFSTLTFPALREGRQGTREDRARVGGHAAGYAAGLRIAELEASARRSELEADYAATIAHASARLDRVVSALQAAARALENRTVPVLESAHAALAEGAMHIAEAVIASELSDAGAAARSAMHRALESVDASRVLTVRMNPADLSVIDQATIDATGVSFTADPQLGRGDAVTDFPDGYLDARISSALDRARTAIAGERS